MTPQEYCKEKASASGSSFYYSFLFLPPEKNSAIIALYAFCREVDDIVDECREPALAQIKLQWWRNEIKSVFDGQPQHPVARALVEPVRTFNLQQEYFLEIIDGMEMDLFQTRYPSFKELNLYCYRVASAVGLLAAEIFEYKHRDTLKYAHNLGIALQLTNILRDISEDAGRGRIYIPQDELKQFGVNEHDILQGNMNEQVRALFEFQANRAQDFYHKAWENLPTEDRYAQLSGIVMAEIYHVILEKIRKQHYAVMNQRIRLSPVHKLWIAWNTVRREKKLKRKI